MISYLGYRLIYWQGVLVNLNISYINLNTTLLVFEIGYNTVTKGYFFVEQLGTQIIQKTFRNLVPSSVSGQPKVVSEHNPQRALVLQDVWTANGCNFKRGSVLHSVQTG